jgi:hypothetical protein
LELAVSSLFINKVRIQTMKRLWIFSIFMLGWVPLTRAQILITLLFGDKLNSEKLEFGLAAGFNASFLTNYDNTRWNYGPMLGMYFNWMVTENLHLHPEILPLNKLGVRNIPFTSSGIAEVDSALADFSSSRQISYITIPLLVRYRVVSGLFVEGGPLLSLRSGGKDIYEKKADDGDVTITKEIKKDLKYFDFGLSGGLHWRFVKNMSLGVRFSYNFVDVSRTDTEIEDSQNAYLQTVFNIPIGAGKAKEKREAKELEEQKQED